MATNDTTYTALVEALNDEYAALTSYQAIMAQFGATAPFVNLAQSEQGHIDTLTALLQARGDAVPANPYVGTIAAPATLQDAYALGVTAETANAEMYDRLIATTEDPAAVAAFQTLQWVSLERHLPALERALSGGGTAQGSGGQGSGQGGGGGQGSGAQTGVVTPADGLTQFDQAYGADGAPLQLSSRANALRLADGGNVIAAGAGADTLIGGADADRLSGQSDGDSIHGGGGRDEIRGGRGDDALWGGDGADTVYSGQGSDFMVGGADADIFVFTTAGAAGDRNVIADFDGAAGDRLLLPAGASYMKGVDAATGDALLTLWTGETIRLAGIAACADDWLLIG